MNRPVIVCPPDAAILKATGDLTVVLKVRSLASLTDAFHMAGGNRVHAMHVEVKGKLSDIPLRDEWKDMPIALFIDQMGSFIELVPKLGFFRTSKTTIFFPSGHSESYVAIQILASLGVSCGLALKDSIDWEAFNNLQHYALYPKVPHAPIEPFEYICASYKPEETVAFNHIYFKDDTKFFEIDQPGSISDISDVDAAINEKRKTQASRLRRFMQENEQCARCKAWKICLGQMKAFDSAGAKCSEVMSELLEIVSEKYNLKYSQTACRP